MMIVLMQRSKQIQFTLVCLLGWCFSGFANADDNGLKKQEAWGHLKGRIVVEGDAPAPKALSPNQDQAVCSDQETPLVDETVIVGSEGGLRDVYIMLYLDRGEDPPAVHASYEESFQEPVILDNKQCRFVPHATFARVGQIVRFSNSDPVGHNTHTYNNDEKNKNIPAGGFIDVTYETADRVPADVECNIHTFMKGTLLIRDDPYVAITSESGEFEILNIPAGKWKFQFWHKQTGYLRMLTRDGEEFLGRRGEFELEITDGQTMDLGDLVIQSGELEQK